MFCFILAKNLRVLCVFGVQRGRHRRPSQRGPRGGAAAGPRTHWDTGAGLVRFWLVPGQQAVPLHGLRGHSELLPHRDHQERHQVWKDRLEMRFSQRRTAIMLLIFLPLPSGTGEGWYRRGAGKSTKGRSGTVSLDIEFSPP